MRRHNVSEDESWKERLRAGDISTAEGLAFAEFALTRVSRTFALNIRILPFPLRHYILYAYLYCRMADTLEDDTILDATEKVRLLPRFTRLFVLAEEGETGNAIGAMREFANLLPREWISSSQWEHLLLIHGPVVLLPLLDFPRTVRRIVSQCVGEMCVGMADFSRKQSGTGAHPLIESIEDLDQYCYYVAGTVGTMLCELFILHSNRIDDGRAKNLRRLCVSFGIGLQLTNILKDLHDDKDRDVSWLPGELLAAEHLTFQDFLHSPTAEHGRRRIYGTLFAKAQKHLEDALEYSCLIPRLDNRLRLFCLWPLFMAVETLALLAESTEALTSGVRFKISRDKVKTIVRRTRLFGWSNRWIRSEFDKAGLRLENALRTLAAT